MDKSCRIYKHVSKRLAAGNIGSEQDYADMTLKALATAEMLVLAMPPVGMNSGLPVTGKVATSDGGWIVLLNADGGMVTAYPYIVGKTTFEQSHKKDGHDFYEIPLGSDHRTALAAVFRTD